MSRFASTARSWIRQYYPRYTEYEGSSGRAWFVGTEQRAPSIAAFFCGDDFDKRGSGRILRHRIPHRITEVADGGGLPILRLHERAVDDADMPHGAIRVPALVDIHTELPADLESLRSQLRTSTTKEDLRRIRKAGFTYRVTDEPAAVREFHAEHYAPVVAQRYPDDGAVRSLDDMLRDLDRGGELVCADLDGRWVAGIFNMRERSQYSLLSLGILDADNDVRNKRVVSALIVRSLERAVELGNDQATLGRSVPFLGKGPVWFKAKWGGIVGCGPHTRYLDMFLDLRQSSVRRMLTESPIIHVAGGRLLASSWLEPGDEPLRVTARDAGRFPGLAQWNVLADPETLAAGAEQLAGNGLIAAVPVSTVHDEPVWLGEMIRQTALSA